MRLWRRYASAAYANIGGIGIGFFAVAAALWVVSMFILFSTVSSVAQPVATVLGGAAVFGAGLVTFKSARESRISAAQTAPEPVCTAARYLDPDRFHL